ncbi:MAG: hypothetical protein Q8S13_06105 [Dehalococcoidia bacterium]|nr:hypothetical protein [Dehalococcoidia bacterium]
MSGGVVRIGRRRVPLIPVERSVVERTAYIFGECSAAAAALKEADAHPGPCCFWRAGDYLLVEKVPAARAGDEG